MQSSSNYLQIITQTQGTVPMCSAAATQQMTKEDLFQELKCRRCNRSYEQHPNSPKHPHLLSCGHIFCKQCIDKLKQDQSEEFRQMNPLLDTQADNFFCPKCISFERIDHEQPSAALIFDLSTKILQEHDLIKFKVDPYCQNEFSFLEHLLISQERENQQVEPKTIFGHLFRNGNKDSNVYCQKSGLLTTMYDPQEKTLHCSECISELPTDKRQRVFQLTPQDQSTILANSRPVNQFMLNVTQDMLENQDQERQESQVRYQKLMDLFKQMQQTSIQNFENHYINGILGSLYNKSYQIKEAINKRQDDKFASTEGDFDYMANIQQAKLFHEQNSQSQQAKQRPFCPDNGAGTIHELLQRVNLPDFIKNQHIEDSQIDEWKRLASSRLKSQTQAAMAQLERQKQSKAIEFAVLNHKTDNSRLLHSIPIEDFNNYQKFEATNTYPLGGQLLLIPDLRLGDRAFLNQPSIKLNNISGRQKFLQIQDPKNLYTTPRQIMKRNVIVHVDTHIILDFYNETIQNNTPSQQDIVQKFFFNTTIVKDDLVLYHFPRVEKAFAVQNYTVTSKSINIYFVGGCDADGKLVNAIQKFNENDPHKNMNFWGELKLIYGRCDPIVHMHTDDDNINKKMYVWGGYTNQQCNQVVPILEIIDLIRQNPTILVKLNFNSPQGELILCENFLKDSLSTRLQIFDIDDQNAKKVVTKALFLTKNFDQQSLKAYIVDLPNSPVNVYQPHIFSCNVIESHELQISQNLHQTMMCLPQVISHKPVLPGTIMLRFSMMNTENKEKTIFTPGNFITGANLALDFQINGGETTEVGLRETPLEEQVLIRNIRQEYAEYQKQQTGN